LKTIMDLINYGTEIMTKSIKTSHNSRFKIVFNGEENCWYIHDKQYGDLIQVSPSKIDAVNMCDKMNKHLNSIST